MPSEEEIYNGIRMGDGPLEDDPIVTPIDGPIEDTPPASPFGSTTDFSDVSQINTLSKPVTKASGSIIQNGIEITTSNLSIEKNISQNDLSIVHTPDYLLKSGTILTLSTDYPTFDYSGLPDKSFIGAIDEFRYAEIRYTLNGKTPSRNSRLYDGPILIKKNTTGNNRVILKYKSFYKGKTSETETIKYKIID